MNLQQIDKLLNGNNAIRSDEAIRSFELQMSKLYNKKFWWVGNYEKIIGSLLTVIISNNWYRGYRNYYIRNGKYNIILFG